MVCSFTQMSFLVPLTIALLASLAQGQDVNIRLSKTSVQPRALRQDRVQDNNTDNGETGKQDPTQEQKKQPQEKVYSGPQPGEKLTSFKMKQVFGKQQGKEYDLIETAEGNPVVAVFVHQRSRPAFALMRTIMQFCVDQKSKTLYPAVCFLTDDPTETQTWLSRINRYFPAGIPVGISVDGVDGPGAYGLNRKVALTIVVGKENKVTASYALVQPSVLADGPEILKSVATAIGLENPDLKKYTSSRGGARGNQQMRTNPQLAALIRKLKQKDASPAAVGEAINAINKLVEGKKQLQSQLGQISRRWVNIGRVKSIGNDQQQKQIAEWAKKYTPTQMNNRARNQTDEKLAVLLRSLIQKTNSAEQVDEAAQAIEAYIKENEKARAEVARISRTIANSDKLGNYGTPRAQEVLKKWARQLNKK